MAVESDISPVTRSCWWEPITFFNASTVDGGDMSFDRCRLAVFMSE